MALEDSKQQPELVQAQGSKREPVQVQRKLVLEQARRRLARGPVRRKQLVPVQVQRKQQVLVRGNTLALEQVQRSKPVPALGSKQA